MAQAVALPGASFLATRQGKSVLALLCVVALMDFLDASIVNVALPSTSYSTPAAPSTGISTTARDPDQAKRFYEAVLRVPFDSGHPGMWRTEETRPPLGIWPAHDTEPQVQLSFRVDDVAAAVDRVRAAGGRAAEPQRRRFGLSAECADDQGRTFRLWQP
jgi:predicted enzyme related to lactoylglutathione lyase